MKTTIKLATIILSVFIFDTAVANNFHIPNYYKNRRTSNIFSSVGWSSRNEVGINYKKVDREDKPEGSGFQDNKYDAFASVLHGYYRINEQFNLEIQAENTGREQDDLPSGEKNENDTLEFESQLGYKFATLPIVMSGGLIYSKDESLEEDSFFGKSTNEVKSIGAVLGMSYKMPNNIFYGLGFKHNDTKREDKDDFGTQKDDQKSQTVNIGMGQVFGDLDSPDAAYEFNITNEFLGSTKFLFLSLQGLYNKNIFQTYGGLLFARATSTGKDIKKYTFNAGVDVSVNDFYFGPEFTASLNKISDDFKAVETNISLQAGYRTSLMEFYLALENETTKFEYDNPLSTDFKSTEQAITIGGVYKF